MGVKIQSLWHENKKAQKKTKRDAMARAVTSRFVAVGQNG